MNTIINDTIDAFEIFTEGNISLEEIQYALNEGEILIDANLFNSLLETYLEEGNIEDMPEVDEEYIKALKNHKSNAKEYKLHKKLFGSKDPEYHKKMAEIHKKLAKSSEDLGKESFNVADKLTKNKRFLTSGIAKVDGMLKGLEAGSHSKYAEKHTSKFHRLSKK